MSYMTLLGAYLVPRNEVASASSFEQFGSCGRQGGSRHLPPDVCLMEGKFFPQGPSYRVP